MPGLRCFPPFNEHNFFFATLVLMICTPLVPDKKIIDVFGKLFQEHTDTPQWVLDFPQWVLDFGEKRLQDKLLPLSMQKKSANNITKAAQHLLHLEPPRDYRDLEALDGVGSKIALLVTLQESQGKAQ
jgi:endonuclease III